MQIKTTMRYHLPITKLDIAKLKTRNASKDVKNPHLYIIGRHPHCYTHYRKYNEDLQSNKYGRKSQEAPPSLRICPQLMVASEMRYTVSSNVATGKLTMLL